jgi:hypothetical protein
MVGPIPALPMNQQSQLLRLTFSVSEPTGNVKQEYDAAHFVYAFSRGGTLTVTNDATGLA